MSVITDLELNEKIQATAIEAKIWFDHNATLQAMADGVENIMYFELPEQEDRPKVEYYYQEPTEQNNLQDVRFGHLVTSDPNFPEHAPAATTDIPLAGGSTVWCVCAVHIGAFKERDIAVTTLVHEITHASDFIVTKHKPRATNPQVSSFGYYNSPHEFNAYFHQGLYRFRQRADQLKWQVVAGRREFRHYLNSVLDCDQYWPRHFVANLNVKYSRKLRRRVARLLQHLIFQPT